MKAGREMDALVAEHVLGMDVVMGPPGETGYVQPVVRIRDYWAECPGFSVSMDAAMAVVAHLPLAFTLERLGTRWFANFDRYNAPPSETAPHAICLAALAAVGYPVPAEAP